MNEAAAGGGVDINRILQTADRSAHPSDKRGSCAKHKRQKKKVQAPPEGNPVIPVILSRSKSAVQPKVEVEVRRTKGDAGESKEVTPVLLAPKKPGSKQLNRSKKRNTDVGRGKGASNSDSDKEISVLKQQLFEATRDLDKERNTRTMLENKVKSLSHELKEVKQTLGDDKHFCIGTLKKELDHEQRLRQSVQDDLTKSNDMIVLEQNENRALQKEVESQKNACNSMKKELEAVRGVLESERILHRSIQSDLSSEKHKSEELQQRLRREIAVTVAIRMELNSMKTNRDRDAEKETCLSCRCKVKSDRCTVELPPVSSKSSYLKRPKATNTRADKEVDDEKDRLVKRLRKELHETRMKLKNERRKGAASVSRTKKKIDPRRSMSDWVVAPTSRGQHAGLIPIIQSPSSVNMPRPMPRAIEASLPGSNCTTDSSPSPALPSLFHFEEDDVSIIGDKSLDELHDELTFIKSAYDPDEIIMSDREITHILELIVNESETVSFAVTVSIPQNYPASGVLDVKASIHDANCSHEVRKCAVDALSELEE